MPRYVRRNESTPDGQRFWEGVERAASEVPAWIKKEIETGRIEPPGKTGGGQQSEKVEGGK